MLWNLFMLLGGFGLLIGGADLLVRGGASIATRARIRPIVIGLTIVAFGTSCPELVICLLAAVRGNTDVSIGNVVGSNMFNILAILGIAALFRPVVVQRQTLRYEMPMVIGVSVMLLLMSLDGVVGRADGGVLLVLFVLFMAYCYRTASVRETEPLPATITIRRSTAFVITGCLGLCLGGPLAVHAAVGLAQRFGISELVIGLTVVAFGTSLPELVTSVIAAIRKHDDLSVGNVLGSNIFNMGLVLGLTALLRPIPVSTRCLQVDIPLMLLATIGVLPLMWTGRRIIRWEGALLLLGIITYAVARIYVGDTG